MKIILRMLTVAALAGYAVTAAADELDDRIWAALAAQLKHEGAALITSPSGRVAHLRKRYDDNRREFSMWAVPGAGHPRAVYHAAGCRLGMVHGFQ